MAITQKDRDDFLKRLGAVRKVRRMQAGIVENSIDNEKEWSGEEIEAAIVQGF